MSTKPLYNSRPQQDGEENKINKTHKLRKREKPEQNQNAKCHVFSCKEVKIFFYFPSASNVQPFPGKQDFSQHSSALEGQYFK